VYSELVNTIGVHGVVTDVSSGRPLNATISIPNLHIVTADSFNGDYYKLLTPGTYQVTASVPGYTSQTKTANIPTGQTTQARLDFALVKN